MMKNTRILFAIVLFTLTSSISKGQSATKAFRVVGYFKGDLENGTNQIDFKKITHLNIAFVNPDSSGNFGEVKGLRDIVKNAHRNQVKVLVSIGGGRSPAYIATLISPSRRAVFIGHLSKLMLDNQLDGLDIDIEGTLLTADYEGFIIDLAQVIKPKGLLTAAVATTYGNSYTTAALEQFDVINIMSYDKTGPWRPGDPGPHATMEMAVTDIEYWQNQKAIPKEKLSLGLPFYGYSFGPAGAGSMSYKKIAITYPADADKDQLKMENGSVLYYNGTETIKTKTRLALDKAGGIMIWQLAQDGEGKTSLLDLIDKEIKARTVNTKH